ncbi:hypothetical protein pEaSNUABM28_00214 [Erwinia phage pEa_SNUABM_28]|uniref:Uncharacterized protein n=2 Tax=Alexandravirus TaxID=2733088 RepID=A0AAE9BUM7_9CAUD|nr:hypothetical protein MPK63_gp211 [Erwinia phage pEa_SNUABM_22]YP_010299973.1 hypothetical protein MPK64_gp212 [Erwinia phage pEa_SNUABM_16]QZE58771.1 hypothetical protein pEaSNUABM28_00214 [Erwinia phage pEa_SNUABM_28]QZE59115.1 hypothetical protein pEaSNUABM18_00212 [Erwinia phage pEa_SNUABM_18]UAW96356.1 hypothetical protein pEaSNUABM16_00212 [Erwinia phage pEa_SNUABM_16]UAW96699.1 hypothetical protein pEaSNUABM22_00212 [Erwinia phage pEa_SNUABM_22]
MEIFVSLSKITVGSEGMAKIDSPCTTPDLKKLASLIFGLARFDQDTFGSITTRKGTLSAVREGEEGAIWLLGDTRLKDAGDFQQIMKPMPMLGPTGAGDFYLTLNVPQRPTQFLICPKGGHSILWFGTEKALADYYAERDAKPSVKMMLTGNRGNASVIRSWSGADIEDEEILQLQSA